MATADVEPVSVETREQWFNGHSSHARPLWVIEGQGDFSRGIDGWLSLQDFYGRPAYNSTAEVSVYIAPAAQRRGYGRELLTRAVDRAPELGLATLLAFIFGHNTPSLALFRALGFETWGHLPGIAMLDGVARDLAILGRRVG
jgi:L-amino acid N-acyltransferase YncA